MNSAARHLLRTLRDLEGVIGSFLLSESGDLMETDLPATFDRAAFDEAGPRIARLAELGGSYGEQTRFFLIRFAEYKLYVRVLRGAFLGVLLMPAASMPALRAATGVVARRAESLFAAMDTQAVSSDAPDTLLTRPSFDTAPPSSHPVSSRPAESPRHGGSALGAPPALTSTLPSITLPEPEAAKVENPSRRAIRFRGRSL